MHQLEELLRTIPPYVDDPLERALTEISSLATNMNEGKRESESRHKLVQWQARIRGKFPSPLVQPHRWVSFLPKNDNAHFDNDTTFDSRLIVNYALKLS